MTKYIRNKKVKLKAQLVDHLLSMLNPWIGSQYHQK